MWLRMHSGHPTSHQASLIRATTGAPFCLTGTTAQQATSLGVEDRLLWLDGFQSADALSNLLMCSAAFLAPFDEQSPTSVSPSWILFLFCYIAFPALAGQEQERAEYMRQTSMASPEGVERIQKKAQQWGQEECKAISYPPRHIVIHKVIPL